MDSLSVSITAANDTPLGAEGDLPLMLPGRPKMRYDFPKAWHHFKELVKDKENTAEVAKIFEALPWRGVYPGE